MTINEAILRAQVREQGVELETLRAEYARVREALEASTDLLDRVEKAFTQAWCIDWNDIPIQAERNRKALEEPK